MYMKNVQMKNKVHRGLKIGQVSSVKDGNVTIYNSLLQCRIIDERVIMI